MPSLDQHESSRLAKILCAADSGSGKTGALASLVDAGLKLRILDFDNGLGVLAKHVTKKDNLSNVRYATLRDDMKLTNGRLVVTKATAFPQAMTLLEKGGGEWGEDTPPITQWDPSYVLVVDTLGMMSRCCLNMVMALNNHFKQPEIQHYGQAMENIERLLGQLTDDSINCNVIINTHLYGMEGTAKLFPEAIGSKLGPKLARYFDNFYSISISGTKRTFKTSKDGQLALKSIVPFDKEPSIEEGYATIFKKLIGVTDLASLGA